MQVVPFAAKERMGTNMNVEQEVATRAAARAGSALPGDAHAAPLVGARRNADRDVAGVADAHVEGAAFDRRGKIDGDFAFLVRAARGSARTAAPTAEQISEKV